jgi:hypothetical protein
LWGVMEKIRGATNVTRLRMLFNRSVRLYMSGCGLSDRGAMAIGHAIEKNKTLKFLALSDVL